MPDDKPALSAESIREMFRLVGVELTDEQIAEAGSEVTTLARSIARLREAQVGEAEPVFFLPPDAGSR